MQGSSEEEERKKQRVMFLTGRRKLPTIRGLTEMSQKKLRIAVEAEKKRLADENSVLELCTRTKQLKVTLEGNSSNSGPNILYEEVNWTLHHLWCQREKKYRARNGL